MHVRYAPPERPDAAVARERDRQLVRAAMSMVGDGRCLSMTLVNVDDAPTLAEDLRLEAALRHVVLELPAAGSSGRCPLTVRPR